VKDLDAATGVVMRETGQRRPTLLLRESSGGLRAPRSRWRTIAYDRLVLSAFRIREGSPTLADRANRSSSIAANTGVRETAT